MKIAIATEGNAVSGHFGGCSVYTVFDVDMDKKTVLGKTLLDAPEHQPGMLPVFLNKQGVNVVIAGGMGMRAQQLFIGLNIDPILGVTGMVDDVIQQFLAGTLVRGESSCNHHGDGHGDGHGHGEHGDHHGQHQHGHDCNNH